MADPTSDDLFAVWRKQVEAGTDAWIKSVQEMASQGQVPHPPDPTQFWRQFSNLGPMASTPFQGTGPIDPQALAQWKKFLDDWIAAWSRALEQAMGTETFAEALGKTLDQFLTIQGKARQAVERSSKATIDALGMPSRDQVVGLSRQMMDLEDRLEGLEDKLDALRSRPPAPAPAPAAAPAPAPAAAPAPAPAAAPAPTAATEDRPRPRRPSIRKTGTAAAKTPKRSA